MEYISNQLQAALQCSTNLSTIIDDLTEKIKQQDAAINQKFENMINKYLSNNNIHDQNQINFVSEIIKEKLTDDEISRFRNLIKSQLILVNEKLSPEKKFELSTELVDSYLNVINTSYEASKARSSNLKDLQFSTKRIIPGFYLFVYSESLHTRSIIDNENQNIAVSVLKIKLVHSNRDLTHAIENDYYLVELYALKKIYLFHIALVDSYVKREISLREWMIKDKYFSRWVIKRRRVLEKAKALIDLNNLPKIDIEEIELAPAIKAVERIFGLGISSDVAANTTNSRLMNGYFTHSLN